MLSRKYESDGEQRATTGCVIVFSAPLPLRQQSCNLGQGSRLYITVSEPNPAHRHGSMFVPPFAVATAE